MSHLTCRLFNRVDITKKEKSFFCHIYEPLFVELLSVFFYVFFNPIPIIQWVVIFTAVWGVALVPPQAAIAILFIQSGALLDW